MSSNVGLSTPRGSGTSGYVQRNAATLKPRSTGYGQPYSLDAARPPRIRKPDEDILRHDRLREIEVKVAELEDKLEEEGQLDEEEVEAACEKERQRLISEMEGQRERGDKKGSGDVRKAKGYQVHELAEAKARESERLRRALGLRGDEAREGAQPEHPMAREERRKRERAENERIEHRERERERGDEKGRRYDDD